MALTFKIDHYKIWEVVPKPVEQEYDITDQFHDDPLTVKLNHLVWIANPVRKGLRKNDNPDLLNPHQHFTGYSLDDLDDVEPDRSVKVTNQLSLNGTTWTIKYPRYLLIPAAKSAKGIGDVLPDKLTTISIEHFLCYEVVKGQEIRKQLFLKDQFDTTKEEIYGLIPKFFGIPGKKDAEVFLNTEDHLAIYLILQHPKITFAVRDQRDGVLGLEVQTNRYLAVPSKKKVL